MACVCVCVCVYSCSWPASACLVCFLQSGVGDPEGQEWIGNPSQVLEGFHWRGGTERDTMGILMWSEPFFRTLPTGEEVCGHIILVILLLFQLSWSSRLHKSTCVPVLYCCCRIWVTYRMSCDCHYGFVQSRSLASRQYSSVPAVRAIPHYCRTRTIMHHCTVRRVRHGALRKLHAINVVLTSYRGQYRTEYLPSWLRRLGRYSPVLPSYLVNITYVLW